MRVAEFLQALPTLFEDWGAAAMRPKHEQFASILDQIKPCSASNLLQVIQAAGDYLEPGEVFCEIGCLAGGNLIAALAAHADLCVYGIDFYSTDDEAVDARMAALMENLEKFDVLDRVAFSHAQPTDFFRELRESGVEDRFGVLVYNFEPDYRQVLMSLVQGSQWCADQAIMVVTQTNNPTVRQAVGDFLGLTNQAMVAIDWQCRGPGAFGCQGLGVIAWDSQAAWSGVTPVVVEERSEVAQVLGLAGEKKKVLHVGCGPYNPNALPPELRTEEWQEVRLDINPAVNPDILGTITDLSAVPDESMDAVYSSHNIEHIYTHEVPLALQEFKRVLKSGGKAVITCPDIQAVAMEVAKGNLEDTLYVSPAGPIAAIDILYGLGTDLARGNFYMAHKTAFTVETLKNKLLQVGFDSVEMRQEWLNLWATAYKQDEVNPSSKNYSSHREGINLYLDLMKKSLMNLIYDNDLDMMRGKAYEKDLKIKGEIWPSFAHTMIGLPRLNNIQFCVENLINEKIPGDFIETGVWRGGATIFMRSILKAYGVKDRKVWVADSFEGLPPTEYKDDLSLKLDQVDCLAISLEQVQSNFKKYDLLDDQVLFLKGWFKDTLPIAPIKQLALMRLDGDWYESTMDALINLYPKLSIGGFVIIDDYWAVKGCRDAVNDFWRTNNIQEKVIKIDDASIYWRKSS